MLYATKDQLEIISGWYEQGPKEEKRLAKLLAMLEGIADMIRGLCSMVMDGIPEKDRDMESMALFMTVQMSLDKIGLEVLEASKPFIEEKKKNTSPKDPIGALLASLAQKAGIDIQMMAVPEEVFRVVEGAASLVESDCNNPDCPTHGEAVKKRVEGKNN